MPPSDGVKKNSIHSAFSKNVFHHFLLFSPAMIQRTVSKALACVDHANGKRGVHPISL